MSPGGQPLCIPLGQPRAEGPCLGGHAGKAPSAQKRTPRTTGGCPEHQEGGGARLPFLPPTSASLHKSQVLRAAFLLLLASRPGNYSSFSFQREKQLPSTVPSAQGTRKKDSKKEKPDTPGRLGDLPKPPPQFVVAAQGSSHKAGFTPFVCGGGSSSPLQSFLAFQEVGI